MIAQFLKWWAAQLLELLPAHLRHAADNADVFIAEITAQGAGLTIWERQKSRETRLGVYAPNASGLTVLRAVLARRQITRIRLRVPAAWLLTRLVTLPLAAERNWRAVLGFEMDRLTPFKADQLVWRGAVARRDPARGRLVINLAMIPRERLTPAIALLQSCGAAAASIEVLPAGRAERFVVGLLPAAARTLRIVSPASIGAMCAVLAFTAVALPFGLQSMRGGALADRIAALAPAVARVQALRRDRAAGAADRNIVNAARLQTGDPLSVLAAVTQALPNGSYLTQLSLDHLQLAITGQAQAAAPLIAALSAYPVLNNVAFSAPVTRDAQNLQDLFAIQADVTPP